MICDQHTYDLIYKRIIQVAIESKLSPQDIEEKNNAIEMLRQLCRGQKSSYEMELWQASGISLWAQSTTSKPTK